MDETANLIFENSRKIMSHGMGDETADEIKKRILDSIYVAYGSINAQPIVIERASLLPSSGKRNSTIYFTRQQAAVDVATLINGSMTRYHDFSDTYLSKEALHPSDNIPPVLAMAETLESNGQDTIRSLEAAYQVIGALSDAVSIRDRGWDHVTYISISAAAGLSSIMDHESDKFINTLNLAINNNISLRQTRSGELSMWKGCTASNASRNSVFAALLADSGFTGPSPIFSGEMGFFRQVSGPFSLDFSKNHILQTMIKNYPVEYHAMSAAEAALQLRESIKGEITGIEVETFEVANRIIIKDPEKLRPKTKETADHSMPYIIAYCLTYGRPGLDAYDSKYLNDKKILSKIDMTKFTVSDRFNKMYPGSLPVRINVKTSIGEYEKEITVPKGHYKNPYSWEDLLNKGISIMEEKDAKDLFDVVRSLDKRDVVDLFEVMSNVKNER
ncbi:MmgE/PrpD family protein [Oxyplasma meridianum]|uniref:MmgE/PrpD family protein n=1 Tax=Oxyplasma meridianum TaxID=3073602 RepID=A0AAX4NEY5_9ARCH